MCFLLVSLENGLVGNSIYSLSVNSISSPAL